MDQIVTAFKVLRFNSLSLSLFVTGGRAPFFIIFSFSPLSKVKVSN